MHLFLLALGAACLAFGGVYLVARRIDNYGIVDVAWAGGFAPLAMFYALATDGQPWRRSLVAVLAVIWSVRLAWHLGRRVLQMHPVEDGRYRELRRAWARGFGLKMALFFLAQAVVLVVLTWPYLAICRNEAPQAAAWEWVGAVVWALAIAGEAIADAQLGAFKRNPENRGRVCDAGLWRYSRHPNYFFEWLGWIGVALVAWPAPGGWAAAACPAFMLLLLVRVTGVRPTEEQLARSKGAAYAAYRRRTSAFVPWFPRAKPL